MPGPKATFCAADRALFPGPCQGWQSYARCLLTVARIVRSAYSEKSLKMRLSPSLCGWLSRSHLLSYEEYAGLWTEHRSFLATEPLIQEVEAIIPPCPAGRGPRRGRGLLGAVVLVALLVGTGPASFVSQARGGGAAITAHAAALIPPGDAAYLPTSTVLFASVNPSIGGAQGTYLQGLESIFKSEPGSATS